MYGSVLLGLNAIWTKDLTLLSLPHTVFVCSRTTLSSVVFESSPLTPSIFVVFLVMPECVTLLSMFYMTHIRCLPCVVNISLSL